MRTKSEHIAHWVNQSKDDLDSAVLLLEGKKYLHALFFLHLSLEKVCKAQWIKTNEDNVPPKTHNLIFLLSQTGLKLSIEQKEFLLELNRFQIDGRYPDELSKLYKTSTESFVRNKLETAKQLQGWLLSKLQ